MMGQVRDALRAVLLTVFSLTILASSAQGHVLPSRGFPRFLLQAASAPMATLSVACPLNFSASDLGATLRHCNATGSPLCCDYIGLTILKARARYANATGHLILSSDVTAQCMQRLEAALDAMHVAGTAVVLFAQCGVAATNFTALSTYAVSDAQACGDYNTLAQFISTDTAIKSACFPDYTANQTNGAPCSPSCTFPPSLTDGLTWELNRGTGPQSFSSCAENVILAMVAMAPSSGAFDAMASCMWDPSKASTCPDINFDIIDFSSIRRTCQPCIGPQANSSACSSVDSFMAQTCCNAVMAGASLVWSTYAFNHGGNLYVPPVEADACYAAYGDKLEAASIGRNILTDICSLAPDTFSTTHTGCHGLTTAGATAVALNNFAAISDVCAPDHCDLNKCYGNLFTTAVGLASQAGPVSTVIGCAETVYISFITQYVPNNTALALAASCALGLNATYRVSIAAPHATTQNTTAASGSPSSSSSSGAIIGGTLGAAVLAAAIGIGFWVCLRFARARQRRKGDPESSPLPTKSVNNHSPLSTLDSLMPHSSEGDPPQSLHLFTAEELRAATHNFAPRTELGIGSAGKVYKGRLPGGNIVAIKRVSRDSAITQLGNEARFLSQLKHPNLVELIGWCDEGGEQALVFLYMPNGSLLKQLESNPTLSWPTRLRIAYGAACGLQYLHSKNIIHRDVKSSNVLVDHAFCAKVADFGISRVGPEIGNTHITTGVKGTVGYLDPEYYYYHQLTDKSDVFSFGIVLLEMMTGMKPIDLQRPVEQHNILLWARPFLERDEVEALVDLRLQMKPDRKSLLLVGRLALRCVADDSKRRPTMDEVARELDTAWEAAQRAALGGGAPAGQGGGQGIDGKDGGHVIKAAATDITLGSTFDLVGGDTFDLLSPPEGVSVVDKEVLMVEKVTRGVSGEVLVI